MCHIPSVFSVYGAGFPIEIRGVFLVMVRGNLIVRLYDPATAYRLVKVHQRLEENSFRLRPGEFRVEKASFRIKHLDIACVAVVKPQTCEARVGAERLDPPDPRAELLRHQPLHQP